MPELPEVETVRRGLEPAMQGARILRAEARRPDLRFPFPSNFAARLQGRRIEALSRRAKYLLADLDDGNVLVMHLGMSGSFRVRLGDSETVPGEFHHERSALAAHDHVVFHLEGGAGRASITYNDPRRFGFMDLVPRAGIEDSRHFSGMGMEPLGNALDGPALARLFEGKAAPLKAVLLDQKLVAGLGNIYVCEALWQAGLSPRRSAGSVGRGKRADALSVAIRDVLMRAIEAGGSTLRDHRLADGSLGYFQHSFNVYGREGQECRRPGCGGTIHRMVQSGRSTFLCPKCQR